LPVRFQRNTKVVERTTEGVLFLLHPESDALFGLNEVGAHIWKWLAVPSTVDMLVKRVCKEYEVAVETAKEDITILLQNLVRNNLVEVWPESNLHHQTSTTMHTSHQSPTA